MAGNANSGRRPDPAFMHQLRGDPSKLGKDALAKKIEEQQIAASEPPKPAWLSERASKEWDRVVPDLLLLGWVHRLDRVALATYCEAVADYEKFRERIAAENKRQDDAGDVQTFATGAKQISIWRQLANDAEKRANAAGAGFGFTPLARRTMKTVATAPQGTLFPNEHDEAAARYFN